MRQRSSHVLVGIFVIAGALLGVAAVLLFGTGFFEGYSVKAETLMTESVVGLEKGAPVRFRGVKVGVVDRIALAPDLYDTELKVVLVRFSMRPLEGGGDGPDEAVRESIEALVRQGLRVRVATTGLAGVTYLQADMIDDNAERLLERPDRWVTDGGSDHVFIPAAKSQLRHLIDGVQDLLSDLDEADIQGLVAQARDAFAAVEGAISGGVEGGLQGEVSGLLSEGRRTFETLNERLPAVLRSADEAASGIAGAAAEARELLSSPRVARSLGNVEELTARARELLADPRVERALDELTRAASDARAAMAEVEETFDRSGELLATLRGTVSDKGRDVDLILRDVTRITRHLRGLARTLERYPSLAILGTKPEPERSER